MTDDDRRALAVPPPTGSDIDLMGLDPADEGDRRELIMAAHPELRRTLDSGAPEIHLHGTTINPQLHVAMHEVVANQLWADEPPEVWQTAQRLLDAGYDAHEIHHMLGSVVSMTVFEALAHGAATDVATVRDALNALPESWEQQRADIPATRHENRAERRAAQRRHPR